MKAEIHRSDQRARASYGWLEIRYSFSFADYFNPVRERFGVVRVLNEVSISGGHATAPHTHANMEIITIPLKGGLEQVDANGNRDMVREGEVQLLSAGTGITVSEANLSSGEPCIFLQIWIFPETKHTNPEICKLAFDSSVRKNIPRLIISPEKKSSDLCIRQQAWMYILDMDKGSGLDYQLNHTGNGLMVFVIEGEVNVSGEQLHRRDSFEIWGADQLTVEAREDARLLLIEVPAD